MMHIYLRMQRVKVFCCFFWEGSSVLLETGLSRMTMQRTPICRLKYWKGRLVQLLEGDIHKVQILGGEAEKVVDEGQENVWQSMLEQEVFVGRRQCSCRVQNIRNQCLDHCRVTMATVLRYLLNQINWTTIFKQNSCQSVTPGAPPVAMESSHNILPKNP